MTGRSPVVNGTDFNFFEKIDVADTEFPNEAQVWPRFRGAFYSFSLANEGGGVIEYSFNGNTVHGDLTPSTPTQALTFDQRRVTKIWFRVTGGSSTVRVEGWGAA